MVSNRELKTKDDVEQVPFWTGILHAEEREKRKVIEGYLYLCSESECRGAIVAPHKLSVDDLEELYRREMCVSTKEIRDCLKETRSSSFSR